MGDVCALVALLALLGLVILCLLSRMCAGRTRLGAQATATVERAVDRLKKEAFVLRSASQQDELPILALVHNSEALAATRTARALVQEHGLSCEELLDLSAQLQDEQDVILSSLAQEIDDFDPSGGGAASAASILPPPPPLARAQRFRPA